MSDPSDPLSADLVKAGGGLGGGLILAFVAWLKGESNRKDERREIHEKLTTIETMLTKFVTDMALLNHSYTANEIRAERLERRVDELAVEMNELKLEMARAKGFDSGIRKAP